eukprot:Seg3245.1 transcript_id=Seg3245.1/GoldUCD/mRNA.D3Y31 product="Zinc finger C4H2 domain-containing protein" protein_id=Seg3245.1/GoldUCD/D3Y31
MNQMMSTQDEDDMLLAKLDIVKDIRSKTMQLERLKVRIIHQMETIKTDDEHLRDYKSEIDHLKREKLMHIKSLRLIERDLTMLENTIFEAKQEREKLRERTCVLFDEYNPLKREIDTQRNQIGLSKLHDIPNRELVSTECTTTPKSCHPSIIPSIAPIPQTSSQGQYTPDIYPRLSPGESPTFVQVNQFTKYQTERPRRQQPPPMKTCNSCQELIHRNAPVCPMCKAKSKSKNPKRPKRKLENE